jgi:anti-sigma regulatory factor (Ser/Thr protein kinase)
MNERVKIIFSCSAFSLAIAEEIFAIIARAATSNKQKQYHIRIVLSELFSNAYLHGDKSAPDSAIEFEACFNSERFTAKIMNKGKRIAENKDKRLESICPSAESGRGLAIVRKLCDSVHYKMLDDEKFCLIIEIILPEVNKAINI